MTTETEIQPRAIVDHYVFAKPPPTSPTLILIESMALSLAFVGAVRASWASHIRGAIVIEAQGHEQRPMLDGSGSTATCHRPLTAEEKRALTDLIRDNVPEDVCFEVVP